MKGDNEFVRFDFADREVLELSVKDSSQELLLCCKDWQEKEFSVMFKDVAGFEAFNPVREELSHSTVDSINPFIESACGLNNEDSIESFQCFTLWSARDESPVLSVVARSVKIRYEVESLW